MNNTNFQNIAFILVNDKTYYYERIRIHPPS